MNKILVDADGCPVVDITVKIAKRFGIKCIILCDTSHHFDIEGAETRTVSKGADSVDFALVNMIDCGDVVVTQDYGLAAMCLAKKASVINQDGMLYTDDNIDALLHSRYVAKKIRNSGGRLKGAAKRTELQNAKFEESIASLAQKIKK